MDATLTGYFDAWNESDAAKRAALLQQVLSGDAELVDPTGHWRGVEGVSERIGRYQESAPGTKVVVGSGVDAHNEVERYSWRIVDGGGAEVMEGLDVAERDADGRLARILMFFGPLPPTTD